MQVETVLIRSSMYIIIHICPASNIRTHRWTVKYTILHNMDLPDTDTCFLDFGYNLAAG